MIAKTTRRKKKRGGKGRASSMYRKEQKKGHDRPGYFLDETGIFLSLGVGNVQVPPRGLKVLVRGMPNRLTGWRRGNGNGRQEKTT